MLVNSRKGEPESPDAIQILITPKPVKNKEAILPAKVALPTLISLYFKKMPTLFRKPAVDRLAFKDTLRITVYLFLEL